ncbi:984_t:CDS:2 [Gigaspora rosea]|nr:984_t:CDS:2 [Gigaspora rosea]
MKGGYTKGKGFCHINFLEKQASIYTKGMKVETQEKEKINEEEYKERSLNKGEKAKGRKKLKGEKLKEKWEE